MKIIVTGGGTGGHVFPALEVALAAREKGHGVAYFGSNRGQEGRACQRARIPFFGFPSEPLYKLTSPRGMKSAMNLIRATFKVRKALSEWNPNVVFSTGGYASAPVVESARRLGIPYVIHEQNTVPGRTNRILSRQAHCVATTFRTGAEHFPDARVVRTGMPVRSEFREQGSFAFDTSGRTGRSQLLVMGGSQGATAINEAAMATAVRMARAEVDWLHIAGPSHYEGMMATQRRLALGPEYTMRAYLDGPEMAAAVFRADLAICRSGAGSLAELAAFRKPSILIPYPQAFANHQALNAKEFEDMGAALVLRQEDLQPSALEGRILMWLHDEAMQSQARAALAEWDIPDATSRILALLDEAAT